MTDIVVDVAALASLARLEVPKEELETLKREIPTILAFVETIQKADTSGLTEADGLRNVMRSDESAHEPGAYTEPLLSAAPTRKGDRIAVKQVISRKKS